MEAWVLNLDAEMEMARPRGYTPSRDVAAHVARAIASLEGLVPPGAVVVRRDAPPPPEARGAVGYAWSPTPSALRALRAAGAVPAPCPPFEVVRRVNARAFCASLGQDLPGARLVRETSQLVAAVKRPTSSGTWLAKRAFSVAGRGRRKLAVGAPSPEDLRWVEASLTEGPLQLEPWVEVVTDLSVHGTVAPGRGFELGVPCVQRVDAHGAFVGATRVREEALPAGVHGALLEEAARVGRALGDAGYFGPFGIDGYLYREGGSTRLIRRSEINARYTMAWAVGMGHTA